LHGLSLTLGNVRVAVDLAAGMTVQSQRTGFAHLDSLDMPIDVENVVEAKMTATSSIGGICMNVLVVEAGSCK
jgi:hypothetical protein